MRLINKFSLFIGILFAISFFSCQENKPDEIFYKEAEILDIKRDDDGQYHLLVRYEDGTTLSAADVGCKIIMGEYSPTAEMPYVKSKRENGFVELEGWRHGNYKEILVYLPLTYKIDLIED